MEEACFLERHPWVRLALLLLLGLAIVVLSVVLFCFVEYNPPYFSVTVSSFEGLDRSAGAAAVPPTFHVDLRVKNGNVVRTYCFRQGSAVVAYDGVPLARVDLLDGFCVPGQSVVKVPVVATGDGLGLPDQLYERVRRHGVPLEVRVRLDEHGAMLLRCTATLDGRPTSTHCPLFFMVERGIDGPHPY